MSSKFDGLVLPTLPLEKQQDKFTLDMHLFFQNLLRSLKEYADAQEPVYFKRVALGDDETWDNKRSGIYIISGASGTIYAIANAIVGGAITFFDDSGNWDDADTNAKYCLYDNTTGIRLKNRIGSAKEFMVMIISND